MAKYKKSGVANANGVASPNGSEAFAKKGNDADMTKSNSKTSNGVSKKKKKPKPKPKSRCWSKKRTTKKDKDSSARTSSSSSYSSSSGGNSDKTVLTVKKFNSVMDNIDDFLTDDEDCCGYYQ